jgi:NADH:ubiquinone oxidoreductase subunit F (NADH-binding)/NADH:ubiquinone oxidoreductase subunit E
MNEPTTTAFRPGVLVQRLREIQKQKGYLPIDDKPGEDDLYRLAEELKVPLYRIQEVASFFPHFRLQQRPPEIIVQICRDMSCHLAGVRQKHLDEWNKEFSDRGKGKKLSISVEGASCLGRCDRAPVMCVTRNKFTEEGTVSYEHTFGRHLTSFKNLDPFPYLHKVIDDIVNGTEITDDPKLAKSNGALLADSDKHFPVHRNEDWLIDVYATDPNLEPYQVTKNYLKSFDSIWPFLTEEEKAQQKSEGTQAVRPGSPEDIEERHPKLHSLSVAQLLGMGGAGAPAYRKWVDVWNSSEEIIHEANKDYTPEKYIVCNGDESEPGTFKDRELLLKTPHLVVEGVILAGLFLNAKAGYIYIRHEYEEAIEAVRKAILDAEKAGVCGEKLALPKAQGGYERIFNVEVFVSPGGYICGEQGALLEAMSDRRGQPRPRPPEPQANGLNDKPTVVNNVETLSWVPAIIHNGGEWYRDAGYKLNTFPLRPDEESMYKGRRFFSISGDVKKPGVYEIPIGMPLKEVIQVYCGGILHNGHELYAIAPSGPSSGFLPRNLPHNLESVDKEIKNLREGLDVHARQYKALDELLKDHGVANEEGPKKKIEKLINFILESTGDQFKQLEILKKKAKESPTQEERIKHGSEMWKLIDSIKAKKKAADFKVVNYRDFTGLEPVTPEAKKDDRKQTPIGDKVAKKRTEWEGRDDLNRRILYTLEQLKANEFRIDELPMDLNVFRNLPKPLKVNIDILLGAGVVIYDSTRKTKMLSEAVNLTQFFANESCGKCVPCRLGSEKLVTIGTELLNRERKLSNAKRLVDELGFAMKQTSICSLGTSAPNPIYSLMESKEFDCELPK